MTQDGRGFQLRSVACLFVWNDSSTFQYGYQPLRCQPTTVLGWTMIKLLMMVPDGFEHGTNAWFSYFQMKTGQGDGVLTMDSWFQRTSIILLVIRNSSAVILSR